MATTPNVLKAIAEMPISPAQLSEYTEETLRAMAGLSIMDGEDVGVVISLGGKIAAEIKMTPAQAKDFLSEPKSDIY